MRLVLKAAYAVVCAGLTLSPAAADETIIVTATRIPTSVERFGGAATVITAADIQLYQYRDISDALASVPGLHVASSGGTGAQTSVFIRGAESNQVLVLIDGIEVTDPASGGSFGFEHFQLNNVERIEVLRGPYSALYGSEGIGGVINIITRRGEGAPVASARIETGSFATNAASANLSGSYDRVDFSFSGAGLQTDGESFTPRRLRNGEDEEDDGYDNFDAKGAVGVEISNTSRLDFNFGYTDADLNYDEDIDIDRDFLPDLFETTPKSSVREKRYRLRWSGDYLQDMWRPSLQGAYYSRQSDGVGRGERTKFEWRNDLFLSDSVKFVVGVETELEKVRSSVRDAARTNAVYAQSWFEPFPGLSLSGGWRNDDADDFGSERSWQLAAAYAVDETGVRLRASYGTAFKAPTLIERFGFGGNPDLNPETSRSWEVGVEQSVSAKGFFSHVRWGATYFNNRLRDLITASFDSDTGAFRNENVSSAQIRGVESFVSVDALARLNLRLDYTLMSAYNGDDDRLLRRPLRKATLATRWSNPVWSFTTKLDYVGPQRDIRRDDFSLVTKGGYALANVSARRRLNDEIALFARVNNLSDRNYEPIDGFAGRGIEFHVGVEIDL